MTGKNYWLLKSEPTTYSFSRLQAEKKAVWDGVRNGEARSNLRKMSVGDVCFFYHSNEGKDIVGVAEVVEAFYPDPADKAGKLGMVDIAPVMPARQPVTLAAMKANPELAGMALLRQSRLSVCPVTDHEWAVICQMAGIPA